MSDTELAKLREEFEQHKREQERRWEQLAAMVEKNTRATERLAKSTEGVVRLYSDIQGAARVGVSVRKLMTWLISLGAGGAALASAILYILEKVNPPT